MIQYNLDFELITAADWWADSMNDFLLAKIGKNNFEIIPLPDGNLKYFCNCSNYQQAFDIGAKFVGLVLDLTIRQVTQQ